MLGKVGRGDVVEEIIEWGDDRVAEEVSPGDRVGRVKRRIERYRDRSCKKPRRCYRGKGQRPGYALAGGFLGSVGVLRRVLTYSNSRVLV